MPVSERWDTASSHGLCFRCLTRNHRGRDCKNSRQCSVDGCRSNHHRLLHTAVCGVSQVSVPSLRTVPVILKNRQQEVVVNALLDDVSTQSFLNSGIAGQLGLHGNTETLNVKVLNDSTQQIDSMKVAIRLQSMDSKIDRDIIINTVDSVTGNMTVVDWRSEAYKWPHLNGIAFPALARSKGVEILIGLHHQDLHFSHGEIRGQRGEPAARLTPLGWTWVSAPRI